MPYEQMELKMPNREKETLEAMRDLVHTVSVLTPQEQERFERTLKLYQVEYEACKDIFIDRNRVYKNTFEVLGLAGTVVTLIGDCYRLRNMILKEPDHGQQYKEQIVDKLRDVVNQAIISLMMVEQDNWTGKD